MEITDIRVRKINKEGKMKAVVSVTFDNEFVVHDIKVIEGDKGRFIAMPSRKTMDGEFRDIAHPINSATREKIQTAVLEKYEMILVADENDAAEEVAAAEEANDGENE
ncbi:MAG: septation regulator SpoVG [Epulopiscium sp.]|jgi:stage V sporulation protein G|nr:septation regulator SpoVG [Candidatus Epulonipiscium sp.]HOQ17395.1 septation regulator SpoVG [Defluviitaleaceae bacterium]HPT76269.1 septation regulator SpoVG [Defluviitaleaceae bacterium]